MRTLHLLFSLVSFGIATSASAALDPSSIRSPRPGGWVADQVGLLAFDQRAEIDALGDAVHARAGGAVAVVIVNSTEGADHRDFATRLFQRWGIGDRDRGNGLLIFVAIHDRAAEIILGTGIDDDAHVAISDRIMQQEMVPHFQRGENAAAVLAGVRACARDFFSIAQANGPSASAEPMQVEAPRPLNSPAPVPRSRGFSPSPVLVGVAQVGGVGVVGWFFYRLWARRRPRRCPRCSMTMTRLEEKQDDAHLTGTEQLEEKLGSVNYDVWLCRGCGGVDKVRFGAWFTRYSRCPQCGAVTTAKSQRILQAASSFTSGLVEVEERCQSCSHVKIYTRVTPRLPSSSQQSSGRTSGFGGGRTSGRGSSGKW